MRTYILLGSIILGWRPQLKTYPPQEMGRSYK